MNSTSKASYVDKVEYHITNGLQNSDGDIEYICQHPRWDAHTKLLPCSVYMSFHRATAVTTYIVVSGEADICIAVSRKRLEEAFSCTAAYDLPFPRVVDPFYFHNIVAQESFLQSRQIITKLRHRLYDALDDVDAYGAGDRFLDRAALRALTNELHLISQDADALLSSAGMGTMVIECMHKAHGHLKSMSDVTSLQGFTRVDDSLGYLAQTLQARRRWLLSYKSRKDIAMNLVSLSSRAHHCHHAAQGLILNRSSTWSPNKTAKPTCRLPKPRRMTARQ